MEAGCMAIESDGTAPLWHVLAATTPPPLPRPAESRTGQQGTSWLGVCSPCVILRRSFLQTLGHYLVSPKPAVNVARNSTNGHIS